jgi:ABC-type transport system involved in cytochrome c biogenesis permease subunit
MAIKYTIQGLLIYEAMGLYLLSLLVALLRFRKLSVFVFFLGFAASLAALVYRGLQVGHFPLGNLFEVFLFLGASVFPIYVFCSKFLKIRNYIPDVVIGIVVLFPAGFVFSAESVPLPPVLQSMYFVPHVLMYMLAYIIMTKAAVSGFRQLGSNIDHESEAYKLVCLGFPLLTLGLVLGSLWAKVAWGRYWGWDPKEIWSLATWLVYVSYFHFRARHIGFRKTNASLVIAGFIFIVITLLWVNLSRIFSGLHSYA